MSHRNRHRLMHYTIIAAIVLAAGLLISLSPVNYAGRTWWLLLLAVLAWGQGTLLRRDIITSGLPLRLFSTLSWALLGFALVSLLPGQARLIGDILVLLVAVTSFFVGPRMRRAR